MPLSFKLSVPKQLQEPPGIDRRRNKVKGRVVVGFRDLTVWLLELTSGKALSSSFPLTPVPPSPHLPTFLSLLFFSDLPCLFPLHSLLSLSYSLPPISFNFISLLNDRLKGEQREIHELEGGDSFLSIKPLPVLPAKLQHQQQGPDSQGCRKWQGYVRSTCGLLSCLAPLMSFVYPLSADFLVKGAGNEPTDLLPVAYSMAQHSPQTRDIWMGLCEVRELKCD